MGNTSPPSHDSHRIASCLACDVILLYKQLFVIYNHHQHSHLSHPITRIALGAAIDASVVPQNVSAPYIDVFSVPLPLVRRHVAVVKLGAGDGGHDDTTREGAPAVWDATHTEQARKRRLKAAGGCLWMLGQGFLKEEVARIVKGYPKLLYMDVAKLGSRLDYFSREWSMDAREVCQMIAGQPSLWTRGMDGELMKLKLQYWKDNMGYSLHELKHVPRAIMSGFSTLAVRHAAVSGLLGLNLTAKQFLKAVIAGSSNSTNGFGPYYFPMHMRAATSVLKDGTVQDILRPLAARLHDPDSQRQWHEALDVMPPTPAEVRNTHEHRQLYRQLYSIFEKDWLKSPAGVEVLCCEEAAKDADGERRKGVQSAEVASRVEKKEEERRVTRGRSAASKSSKGSS